MSTNPSLLSSGFHFQVAFGQHLWTDLFSNALPVQVGGAPFDLTDQTWQALGLLENQVGNQIKLLSARTQPRLPPPVQEFSSRVLPRLKQEVKRRRDQLTEKAKDAVKVDGKWSLHVTREGTHFDYLPGALHVSAQIKAVADGTIHIKGNPKEYPFHLERLLRGSFTLGNVRYDRQKQSLLGTLDNLHLELGQNQVVKMGEKLIDKLLAEKVGKFNPIPMLKVDQINQSLGDALGALQMMAAIDDVAVDISDNQLVLKVNFMFKRQPGK